MKNAANNPTKLQSYNAHLVWEIRRWTEDDNKAFGFAEKGDCVQAEYMVTRIDTKVFGISQTIVYLRKDGKFGIFGASYQKNLIGQCIWEQIREFIINDNKPSIPMQRETLKSKVKEAMDKGDLSEATKALHELTLLEKA